ncbi:hypothetical protein V1478_008260 [Vespula squamosa]|uniref:Uncharacterized protein n=1 Tax=Vespula squamosa TaxID=30214 RepID=A0ABD2AZ73_VESSQ
MHLRDYHRIRKKSWRHMMGPIVDVTPGVASKERKGIINRAREQVSWLVKQVIVHSLRYETGRCWLRSQRSIDERTNGRTNERTPARLRSYVTSALLLRAYPLAAPSFAFSGAVGPPAEGPSGSTLSKSACVKKKDRKYNKEKEDRR